MTHHDDAPGWNLEPLLFDGGPQALDDLLDLAADEARRVELHVARSTDPSSAELTAALVVVARVLDLVARAHAYCSLQFAADTTREAARQRVEQVEARIERIEESLAEFERYLVDLSADVLADAADSVSCAHYVTVLRNAHQSSTPNSHCDEAADDDVDLGNVRLAYQTALAGIETSEGPLVGVLAHLAHPHRRLRAAASVAITEALEPGLASRTRLFNRVLQHKALDDERQGLPHWLAARNVANELPDASVDALVTAVQERNDLAQRWYHLKAKLLGLQRLSDYDRMAPLAERRTHIGWARARHVVLGSFASFAPQFGAIVEECFAGHRIDAAPRAGKRTGSLCLHATPTADPYILMTYNATERDVLTLAHELGHGVHGVLSSDQSIFEHAPSLALAETAAVFGEKLVLEHMLHATDDDRTSQIALLASSIDTSVENVFRAMAMHNFENSVHTAWRAAGSLSSRQLADLWLTEQSKILGDSVAITPGFENWWSMVPHFVDEPGSLYAYAFGQLLALSMYARYCTQPAGFVPGYLRMLAAGGSGAPGELTRLVQCDVADPTFWNQGLDVIEQEMEALTVMVAQPHTTPKRGRG